MNVKENKDLRNVKENNLLTPSKDNQNKKIET